MRRGSGVFGTLVGVGIVGASLLYMFLDVPLDGVIDIREAALTLGGLALGVGILAGTWLGVLARVLPKAARLAAGRLGSLAHAVGRFAMRLADRVRRR